MKEIKLTQGKVALVDDDDFERLNQFKWHASKEGNNFYAKRTPCVNKIKKVIIMHREIINALPGEDVDHKDGNSLNNLRENLRLCNQAENVRNSKIRKDNISGYRGVSLFTKRNKFQAIIHFKKKSFWLGYFSSPIDAAIAYNQAAIQHFGEFARLNKI
jgi:hypothetical protein